MGKNQAAGLQTIMPCCYYTIITILPHILLQEAEANDVNLGAMGVKRFKSRSFEAWHKAGARHLFPVNPNKAAYQERPYMQRRGGDWEGNDLKELGLEGQGQGVAAPRLKIDDVYEVAEKEGRLNSASIFGGLPLPWTSEAAKSNIYHPTQIKISEKEKAKAGKELSEEEMAKLKALLAKPIITKKQQPAKEAVSANKDVAPPASEAPRKKLFGLF